MTYRLKGQRFLRKYTAKDTTPGYMAPSDSDLLVSSLCTVAWEAVPETDATSPSHTETTADKGGSPDGGLDGNPGIRNQFDAALFCAGHVGDRHRVYANAAVYHYVLPKGELPKLTRLTVRVTSDPYNANGARIALLTNDSGDIPTDCETCRTGDAYAASVAPRTALPPSGNWSANVVDLEFSPDAGTGHGGLPAGGLQLRRHLFLFVLLENYGALRGNWFEGSSYIRNLVEIETDGALPDVQDGSDVDLRPGMEVRDTACNVVRGECLPVLEGEVSGIMVAENGLDGSPVGLMRRTVISPRESCIGLTTLYGKLFSGGMTHVPVSGYGLSRVSRPGVSFSVTTGYGSGDRLQLGRVWSQSSSGLSLSQAVYGLAYGGGVFVAVGSDGVLRSLDGGLTWLGNELTIGCFRTVAYGGGIFVIGGGDSDSSFGLRYSTDGGLTWKMSSEVGGEWLSVAYGGGVFVAVSTGGRTCRSVDGMNWDVADIQLPDAGFYSVAYGSGVFVAVSSQESGIWRSVDGGITWVSAGKEDVSWASVTYGNGVFVAASSSGGGIWYSADRGATWSVGGSVDSSWSAVAYGGGTFVAARSNAGGLWYSLDGQTWVLSEKTDGEWLSAAYGDGVFTVGGNAEVWRSGLFPRTFAEAPVSLIGFDGSQCGPSACGDGVLVVSVSGSGLWRTSDRGKSWKLGDGSQGQSWEAVAYDSGVFVAASTTGLWRSVDGGETWTRTSTAGQWESLAGGGGVFIAGSGLSRDSTSDGWGLVYSTDGGETWVQSDDENGRWAAIAYGGGVFVAAASSAETSSPTRGVKYSRDGGRTWTSSTSSVVSSSGFYSASFGDGVFVLGGPNKLVYSEDNGVTWADVDGVSSGHYWVAVAYGDGYFMAYGSTSASGSCMYSTDGGKTWHDKYGTGGLGVSSSAYVDGAFYMSGPGGLYRAEMFDQTKLKWVMQSSVLFVRFALPVTFSASKVVLDWSGWKGDVTYGTRVNVWLKRDSFAAEYPVSVVGNHVVYDASKDEVDGFKLIGMIDVSSASSATLTVGDPLHHGVATLLLSAFTPMDTEDMSSGYAVARGLATLVNVRDGSVEGLDSSWRPDITLVR